MFLVSSIVLCCSPFILVSLQCRQSTEMPILPQNSCAKYKHECEARVKTNLSSILFTEPLKALQNVSLHACRKKKNQGLCVNE